MRKLLIIIFFVFVLVVSWYFNNECWDRFSPPFYGCLNLNTNSTNSHIYTNTKYKFSFEYPEGYQIKILPNDFGMYLKPLNRPVWEQVIISALVLPHNLYLPPNSDDRDVQEVIYQKYISGYLTQKRLINSVDTGKLLDVIIDRGDYTIQLIYNMPDKILELADFDKIIESLKIW